MSEERKTLKDLKEEKDEETKTWSWDLRKYWVKHFDEFINERLKAEAIKRFKAEIIDGRSWIEFFNITEEDLKGGKDDE